MKTFLIRGVPLAMQRDGWWLNAPPAGPTRPAPRTDHTPGHWRPALLVPLIALGDILIWQVSPGLSLAVFGATLILAALWVAGPRVSAQRLLLVTGGSLLALLPLVELVQPLSILIALSGLSAVLALLAGLKSHELLRGALRVWPMGVRQTFVDGKSVLQPSERGHLNARLSRVMLHWLMPLSLGLLFAVLLLGANPIAARWAERMLETSLTLPEGARMAFWACLIPLAWTALSLPQMRERLRVPLPHRHPVHMGPAREGFINPGSVTRALILFNAVFALQTGMDAIYLYGGIGLPEGITYAEYAHRGAYPLVATALLAGGFALLTRPWVQNSPLLRALLLIWVGQNCALVVSALVRLELYVEVYGLTRLRLSAAIWMGVVAVGLALVLWQIWRGRDTRWLALRCAALGALVLYLCSFLSFDATIARYNLSQEMTPDRWYLCHLGEAAVPVIHAYEQDHHAELCAPRLMQISTPQDWREWGFRNWRARTSLAALQPEATP